MNQQNQISNNLMFTKKDNYEGLKWYDCILKILKMLLTSNICNFQLYSSLQLKSSDIKYLIIKYQ